MTLRSMNNWSQEKDIDLFPQSIDMMIVQRDQNIRKGIFLSENICDTSCLKDISQIGI